MRNIKFRAWDNIEKVMVDVIEINWSSGVLSGVCAGGGTSGKLEDYTLMQYTGLKDKDGKEIYEGDILKLDTDEDIEEGSVPEEEESGPGFDWIETTTYIGVVVWNEQSNGWDIESRYIEKTEYSNGSPDSFEHGEYCGNEQLENGQNEVIGNIYENHELIK